MDGKKYGWQKMAKKWMAKNMDGTKWQKMDGKKYLSMNHPRQKIPEFESSPVKNCWGPMTPVKIWA